MKTRHMPRSVSRRGFTLIEMLLVIVIIGIFAGALITSLAGRSQDARVARARADMAGALSLALDLFEQDVGRYPTEAEGLQALGEAQEQAIPGAKGPYLKGGLKSDPWGNPYEYKVDGARYVLSSPGPDGQAGTDDDIVLEQ